MPIDQILHLLIAERDKLNRAIEALHGPTKRMGRPPKNPRAASAAPKKRSAQKSAAQIARDKAASARMKAYWDAKRKKQTKR